MSNPKAGIAHSLDGPEQRTRDVLIDSNINFDSLYLSKNILEGLHTCYYRKPSPIQLKAIPMGRCGFDLIVKSKAGTGKTLVFTIIALESIKIEEKSVQTLILAPTREISIQIEDTIKAVGQHIKDLEVHSFIGGLPLHLDIKHLKSCHIAVGTPGRIKQLIEEKHLSTTSVSMFILDEADKLMDPSFQNDVNTIYNALPRKKQIIMCSATFPSELKAFVMNYALSPSEICVEIDTPLLLGLKHYVSMVKPHTNIVKQTKLKFEQLLHLLNTVKFTQTVVFTNYQNRSESVSNMLGKTDYSCSVMSISAAQKQCNRSQVMQALKEKRCRILVSTDLIARGIDVSSVDLVINYDIPTSAVTYLHRMGRAGRYGSQGICVNLISNSNELVTLQRILGKIGGVSISIPELGNEQTVYYGIVEDDDSEQLKENLIELKLRESNLESNTLVEAAECLKCPTELKDIPKPINIASQSSDSVHRLKLESNSSESSVEAAHKLEDIPTRNLLESLASTGTILDYKSLDSEYHKSTSVEQLLASKLESNSSESSVEAAHKLEDIPTRSLLESLAATGTIPELKSSPKLESESKKCPFELGGSRKQTNIELLSSTACGPVASTGNDTNSSSFEANPRRNYDKFDDIFSNVFQAFIIDRDPKDEWGVFDDDASPIQTEAIDLNMAQDDGSSGDEEAEVMKWVAVKSNEKKKNKKRRVKKHSKGVEEEFKEEFPDFLETSIEQRDGYERMSTYFDQCSSNLWESGLGFGSVDAFDTFYWYDWQSQLSEVRSYVQQNVYVEEMNNYRMNKM